MADDVDALMQHLAIDRSRRDGLLARRRETALRLAIQHPRPGPKARARLDGLQARLLVSGCPRAAMDQVEGQAAAEMMKQRHRSTRSYAADRATARRLDAPGDENRQANPEGVRLDRLKFATD